MKPLNFSTWYVDIKTELCAMPHETEHVFSPFFLQIATLPRRVVQLSNSLILTILC
jgi:hypothetical protein